MATTAPASLTIPSVTVGVTTNDYLSSTDIITQKVRYGYDIASEIGERFGDEDLGLNGMYEALGQSKVVKSQTMLHFEKDRLQGVIRVVAGYGTGTAQTTFTVSGSSPDYVFDWPPSGESPYPAATTYYGTTIRQGDKLEAHVGATAYYMLVGTVTNASTTTFVATLYDVTGGAATFAAGLADVELVKVGRMVAEEGTAPSGNEDRFYAFTNYIQITDGGKALTGSSMGQKAIDNVNYTYIKGIMYERMRFNMTVDADMYASRAITSTNAAFTGTLSLMGLRQQVEEYGIGVSYTAGSLALDQLQDVSLATKKYGGPDKYIAATSAYVQNQIDNLMRTSTGLAAGGVIYHEGQSVKTIDFGFKNTIIGSTLMNFKTVSGFSNPTSLGNDDLPYQNDLVFLPTGTVQAFDEGKNPVTDYTFCRRYQDIPEHVNGYREWMYGGGATPNPTDGTRTTRVAWELYHGLQMFKLNTYALLTP